MYRRLNLALMAFASLISFSALAQVPADAVKLGTSKATQLEPAYDVMYSPALTKSGDQVIVKVFGTFAKTDDFGIRSMLSEIQFDCKASQFSFVKMTAYEAPNLSGKGKDFPPELYQDFQKLNVESADQSMSAGSLPFSMVAKLKSVVCGDSVSPATTNTVTSPASTPVLKSATVTAPETTSSATATAPVKSVSSLCTVGVKSRFFWPNDKKWYSGTVIDVRPDACLVHYDGYGNEDNGWVKPEHMRLLVLWKDGKKYPAVVLRKQSDKKYLVKYEGYDDSSNEVVDLVQLSIRPSN